MFSQHYQYFDSRIRKILDNIKTPSLERIDEILLKARSEELTFEEIAELLEIGKSPQPFKQFEQMRIFTYNYFRKETNELRHISPVYLSSFCVDTCGYCQFSAKRKDTPRTRLSISQLEEELAKGVFPLGSRIIEFTLATDPHFTSTELTRYVKRTKELLADQKGSGVLLCSDHMTKEAYKELKEAGLWGMVQWDETLDKDNYKRWHSNSPRKSDMTTRMDNHDRAMSQGLEVATGVLFGLSDYRYDVLMQIAKTRYLQIEYGRKPFVFGTPRLKPIGGIVLHPNTEVDDCKYETALMTYKIAEPSIGRWLQTRESPELNLRNILDQDVYTYKCGEVKPGGYLVNASVINGVKGAQFKVVELEKDWFEKKLEGMNFELNYAWI